MALSEVESDVREVLTHASVLVAVLRGSSARCCSG